MKTTIGLFRHGQTDWNVDMRLQGISDIPLNEFGKQQAATAAKVLASQGWQKIVTSPLGRALETAEIVGQVLGISDFPIHNLLLERSFGVAEGLSYDEWRERFQAGENAENSESIEELTERAQLMLDDFAIRFQGEQVLAVSHGAFIRRAIHLVSQGALPREGERFGNASLTILTHESGVWKVESYNPETLV